MNIRGCEKLTEANVIVAYRLAFREPAVKTKFHDELYGRHNDGILSRIPHRKLADGVIEIPQRNFDEISGIFEKYGVDYELRLAIPVKEHDEIVKIVKTLEDPYEKALDLNSSDFSSFVIERLQQLGEKPVEAAEFKGEMLAISDTVQKWAGKHEDDPLASVLPYMVKALEAKRDVEPAVAKSNIQRVAESLKNWAVGYHVLRESNDEESVGELLKKYKARKKMS